MDNYLLNAMDTSLIKDKRKVHLLEALDARRQTRENLYPVVFNEQMTHTPQQTGFMPQPVGDYLNKVISGGYLSENLDRWNQAAANSKAQAFEGAPDTGKGNIMDYFAPAAMTAFHGSPHLFDKFSLEHIGKGEGAQAYGHGLYFAENADVAQQYQRALAKRGELEINGQALQVDSAGRFDLPDYGKKLSLDLDIPEYTVKNAIDRVRRHNNVDDAIKETEDMITSLGKGGAFTGFMGDELTALKQMRKSVKVTKPPSGQMYEVDIPDEYVKNFLDWDAPLSEQPKAMAAYKQLPSEVRNRIPLKDQYGNDIKGGEFYNGLSNYMRGGKSDNIFEGGTGQLGQKEAAEELNYLGIKGIKYFDGSSRKAGEGTRNLVVFDDSIIKTLKRNNEDILPDMLKPQSGDGQQFKQTDKIPEMLKRQSD